MRPPPFIQDNLSCPAGHVLHTLPNKRGGSHRAHGALVCQPWDKEGKQKFWTSTIGGVRHIVKGFYSTYGKLAFYEWIGKSSDKTPWEQWQKPAKFTLHQSAPGFDAVFDVTKGFEKIPIRPTERMKRNQRKMWLAWRVGDGMGYPTENDSDSPTYTKKAKYFLASGLRDDAGKFEKTWDELSDDEAPTASAQGPVVPTLSESSGSSTNALQADVSDILTDEFHTTVEDFLVGSNPTSTAESGQFIDADDDNNILGGEPYTIFGNCCIARNPTHAAGPDKPSPVDNDGKILGGEVYTNFGDVPVAHTPASAAETNQSTAVNEVYNILTRKLYATSEDFPDGSNLTSVAEPNVATTGDDESKILASEPFPTLKDFPLVRSPTMALEPVPSSTAGESSTTPNKQSLLQPSAAVRAASPSPSKTTFPPIMLSHTTFRISLSTNTFGAVPVKLSSCRTIMEFYSSIAASWSIAEDDIEAICVQIGSQTGADALVVKREVPDSYAELLEAIEEEDCWSNDWTGKKKCSVKVIVHVKDVPPRSEKRKRKDRDEGEERNGRASQIIKLE